MSPKKVVMTLMGAVYGGPGMVFLLRGDMGGAVWALGLGLLCLWMAED